MPISSSDADSEKEERKKKAFLWQTEPLRFSNVGKNGRDRAGGKAETGGTEIQRQQKAREEQKALRGWVNCTEHV